MRALSLLSIIMLLPAAAPACAADDVVLSLDKPDDRSGGGNAASAVVPEETKAWIAKLGSGSFEARRTAFLQLWRGGADVLPALDEALSDIQRGVDNRQMAESVGTLELLLKLNIQPDASGSSRQLFDLLNDLQPQKIIEICKLGYWDLAEQLVENNAEIKEALSDDYGRYTLNLIVEAAFEQGDYLKAWPIVLLSTPAHQAAWMARKLNIELNPDEISDELRAFERYFAGDVDGGWALTTSPAAKISMLTRSFQWSKFKEKGAQVALVGLQPSSSQQAARAALYEIAGDPDTAEARWRVVLADPESEAKDDAAIDKAADQNSGENDGGENEKNGNATNDNSANNASQEGQTANNPVLEEDPVGEVAERARQNVVAAGILTELGNPFKGNPAQFNQFMMALLISGRVEAIEQYLTQADPQQAFAFMAARNDYRAAFEQFGLDGELGNLDEWIETQRAEIPEAVRTMNGNHPAVRVAAALVGLGYSDKAERILEMLADIARNEPEFEVSIWQDWIVRSFGRHESRELGLKLAEAHFERMSSACKDAVLIGLHEELGVVAPALFQTAPRLAHRAQDSKWQALEKLRLWDRDYFGSGSDAIIEQWLRSARQSLDPRETSPIQLSKLADLAHNFGLDDLAFELLATDIRETRSQQALNMHWLDAAILYNAQLKPQKALPLLAELRSHGFNLQMAYVTEVDALLMTGQYDRANQLIQSRWLRPLAAERYYGANYLDIATQYSDLEQFDRALEYAEPAFTLADPGGRSVYFAASKYATLAEELEQYQLSADVQRAVLVESLQPYSPFVQFMIANGYTSSIRFMAQQERLARAVACIDAGEFVDARRHLELSHRMQPQDIEVVVQCYPRLIAAGQNEFADQLFTLYDTEMKSQIKAWPTDSTALNNLAWMYSQCNRNLEEALNLARLGVDLAPSSPVFLDTLAEVEYRLGQTEQAIETMRGCVRLNPRAPNYRRNLVRFSQGAP